MTSDILLYIKYLFQNRRVDARETCLYAPIYVYIKGIGNFRFVTSQGRMVYAVLMLGGDGYYFFSLMFLGSVVT